MPIQPDYEHTHNHRLSHQGVWASFEHLKNHPLRHPKHFVGNFLKCQFIHIIESLHLNILPMAFYKDIMPFFTRLIYFYACNLTTTNLSVMNQTTLLLVSALFLKFRVYYQMGTCIQIQPHQINYVERGCCFYSVIPLRRD